MKKFICYLLMVSILIASCVGCGKGKKDIETKEQDEVKTEVESENKISNKTDDSGVVENDTTTSNAASGSNDVENNTSEPAQDTKNSDETNKNTNNAESSTKQPPSNSQATQTTQHTHSYSKSVTNPTCTEQGYTTYACSCGDSYKSDYIAAKGHTEVIDTAVAATTTSTGLTEGKHCSVCGTILIAQQTIAKIELTPAEQSSVTITGVDNVYNYKIAGRIKSATYIESASYSIKSIGGSIAIYVTCTASLTNAAWEYIAFGCELYDSNGVCVSKDREFMKASYGTKYSCNLSFKMVEPGNYTVKIIEY